MELLNRLTIKNLKLNKKRTIVTIIGIILATALITGVATLVTSIRASVIEEEKKNSGNYHYSFEDVPNDDLKYIENNRNIERTFLSKQIGYSKLEKSKNEYKPYLYITAFQKSALENLNIKLIEGRYPENENEIIIPIHLKTNGKVKYEIGEEITLNIGKRVYDGYELNQEEFYNGISLDKEGIEKTDETEEFIPEYTKKYKIVGVMERPNRDIESYYSPGYTAITYLETTNQNDKFTVYTIYKNLKKQDETTSSIIGISKEELEDYKKGLNTDEIDNKIKYNFNKNTSVIRWENLEFNESNSVMIYTVAGVVILIIIITSVFCIRNSFAISITEKTKQYGMLASIGATPKQIRKNVLYEGFILGLIGIPLGIISGILAIFILLQVVSKILEGGDLGLNFIFKINVLSIVISVLLSSITIYLSAKKSAKRASKISPIEAIRSNQDIQIKSKKLKTPKIIKKLFGIGGELAHKNLKRNNKKYRTTVISIVVSVAIFISMTSFIGYAFKTSSIYYTNYKYNMRIYTDEIKQDYDIMKEIAKYENIKAYSIQRNILANVDTSELEKHYSKEYKQEGTTYFDDQTGEKTGISMISLGEQEYHRFIKELGLKYDDVKDKVILIDDMREYVTVNGKSSYRMYRIYDYEKGDKIQVELKDDTKREIEIAAVTDKRPMGNENTYVNGGFFIVSDEFMEKYKENITETGELYIDAEDPYKVEEHIEENFKDNNFSRIYNIEDNVKQEKSMWLVIAIFLYGFITVISLIGITNIFNTITTNMELRQKEFANLKSIGITKKEFNKMIRLESILYGAKSLIIGIPIGIGLSYLLYKSFGITTQMKYMLPLNGIIISIIAVAILVGTIMKYSLNKINKQNIIETIRKDNI